MIDMRLKVISILFILALILFNQCKKEKTEPEPVPPKEFKIIDDNFLSALIDRGFDVNHDIAIDSSEALAIRYLDLDACNISDMAGIKKFINLDSLQFYNNQLTGFDVSNMISLNYLDCRGCGLHILNVSNLTELKYLNCGPHLN